MASEANAVFNDSKENLWLNESFLGEYSIDTIFNGLREQFSNYINTEDHDHYVHIFYKQLNDSYNRNEEVDDEHLSDRKEYLDTIMNKFRDLMVQLFELHLNISCDNLINANYENDVFVFMRLYEFFILQASRNFKTVISADLNANLEDNLTEDQYFYQVQTLLVEEYSPLITTITPINFLRYIGDEDVIEIFESCIVTGNFLTKYTAKLYENESYKIELINSITTYKLFMQEKLQELKQHIVEVPAEPPVSGE